MITSAKKITTKTGKYMCMGEIEDPSARISFVLFPKIYDKCGELIEEEKVLSFEGKLDQRGTDFQFVVNDVKALSLEAMIKKAIDSNSFDYDDKIIGVPSFKLELEDEEELAELHELEEAESTTNETYIINFESEPVNLNELKAFLEAHKGPTKAEIHIQDNNKIKRIKVPFSIAVNKEFEEEIKRSLRLRQ